MARRPANILGVIHTVLRHEAARPILGALSQQDLETLSSHLSAGTLMPGLTPLADTATKAEAIRAMPPDLAQVISKLPDEQLAGLRTQLKGLDRDKNDALVCGC